MVPTNQPPFPLFIPSLHPRLHQTKPHVFPPPPSLTSPSSFSILTTFCLTFLLIQLNSLSIDSQISGHLHNTGQFLIFKVDKESKPVNITDGPLAYRYQFEEIYIHYGMNNTHGSEHRINNYAFPAEVSFIFIYKLYEIYL